MLEGNGSGHVPWVLSWLLALQMEVYTHLVQV